MSLGHYHVDARTLSPGTRAALFKKIDEASFMTAVDMKNPGCFEVFWESKADFVESMGLPSECKVTVLHKAE